MANDSQQFSVFSLMKSISLLLGIVLCVCTPNTGAVRRFQPLLTDDDGSNRRLNRPAGEFMHLIFQKYFKYFKYSDRKNSRVYFCSPNSSQNERIVTMRVSDMLLVIREAVKTNVFHFPVWRILHSFRSEMTENSLDSCTSCTACVALTLDGAVQHSC